MKRETGRNPAIAENFKSRWVNISTLLLPGLQKSTCHGKRNGMRQQSETDQSGEWACIPIYTDDSVFSTGVEIPATEDKIKKELAGHD